MEFNRTVKEIWHMKSNIYIGNRYVPVFANPIQWDDQREYEPLTIVMNNGASYTSRIYVPIGTPLSDSTFWVKTGNYNAQVEEYANEVEQLAEDFETFKGDINSAISTLNGRVDDCETNISSLDSELGDLTDSVDDIRVRVELGKVVCIGDSYLEGYTASGNVTSWGDILATILGKSVGTDLYKFYQGGCGFYTTNNSKNFGTLLNEAYIALNGVANTVGAVIVLGGANDPNNSNVTTNIETFVNNAKTYFPNASVYYGYGSTFVETTPYNVMGVYSRYQQSTKGIFMGNLAKILTAYSDIYYSSDYRHPNANGQKMLAKLIVQCLKGCGVEPISRDNRTVATNIVESIAGGIWRRYCYDNTHKNFEEPTSHTSNNTVLLDTIPISDSYLSKLDNNFYQCHASGFIKSSDGKYRAVTYRLVMLPDGIRVYDTCMNDDGTNYLTSTVEYYQIDTFEFSCPVELI